MTQLVVCNRSINKFNWRRSYIVTEWNIDRRRSMINVETTK